MKQLYYTSCKTGKSHGGSSGFQVRAVSPGLGGDEMRTAVSYAGYALPSNVMPSDVTPETAPVRLALLATQHLGRLLCHSAYVGKDPMTGRYGNFFSHLLLGVPEEVDAALAIRTWGSDFWQRGDNDGGTKLPEENPHDLRKKVERLPPGGALADEKLVAFASKDINHQMLAFVLRALLTTEPDRRIFLCAPAQDVALCVYALTRALPCDLLQGFTFSTYEHEPLTCSARLIGAWYGNDAKIDLPSSCYSGTCLGFNGYAKRKSKLEAGEPYAAWMDRYVEWATDAFKSEVNLKKLDNFRSFCEKLEACDVRVLTLAFQLMRKDGMETLKKEDGQRVLEHEGLSRWILGRPDAAGAFLQRIVGWADEDSEFYRRIMPLAGNALGKNADTLKAITHLRDPVRDRVKSWVDVESFLKAPSLEGKKLHAVVAGLEHLRKEVQEETRSKVIRGVAEALRNAEGSRARDGLENALSYLGRLRGIKGAAGLYGQLVDVLRKEDDFYRRPALLHALFQVGLGDVQLQADLGYNAFGNRGDVGDRVRHLLEQVKNRGGLADLRTIDQRVTEWKDEEAKQRWKDLTKKWLCPAWKKWLGWRWVKFLLAALLLAILVLVVWWRPNGGEPKSPPKDPSPPAGKSPPK